MINFFRKIRKKLLNQNMTGKYLKYAFGEIVLVVIGILIALQINTWNDFRKDRIEEQNLLKNILEDLNRDKEVFDINIQNNEFHKAVLDSMLHVISFKQDYNKMDFLRHNQLFSFFGKFLESKGTYLESLSSGKLSLIQSDSLRGAILAYYEVDLKTLGPDIIVDNDMKYLRQEWNDLLSHSWEYAMAFGINTTFPQLDVKEICKNPRYRKILMQKRGLIHAQIGEWQRVKEVNRQLTLLIKSEIEVKN